MELYVYDDSFKRIGLIDVYDTLIFRWKHLETSTLELLVSYTDTNAELLKIGNILMENTENKTEAFEIMFIKYKTDARGYNLIEVSCNGLSTWLNRRILFKDYYFNSYARYAIGKMCIDSFEGSRNLYNLGVNANNLTESIEGSFEKGKILLEAIRDICRVCDFGYKIFTDPKTLISTIEIYKGKFIGEGTNENVVFSDEYGNILSSEYTVDYGNYKSIGYTIADTGTYRFYPPSDYGTLQKRKEVFFTSNVQRNYTDDQDNPITLTTEQYNAALLSFIQSSLDNFKAIEIFKCDIDTGGHLKFRTDFNIGDTVTCINSKWKVNKNYKISEVKEVYNQGIYKLEIEFGTKQANLFDKLRLLKR